MSDLPPLKPGWVEKIDPKGNVYCFLFYFIFMNIDVNKVEKTSTWYREEAQENLNANQISAKPQAKVANSFSNDPTILPKPEYMSVEKKIIAKCFILFYFLFLF
jgi:hypothetical protein